MTVKTKTNANARGIIEDHVYADNHWGDHVVGGVKEAVEALVEAGLLEGDEAECPWPPPYLEAVCNSVIDRMLEKP